MEVRPIDEITVELPCTLEELYLGTVKRLHYNKSTINFDGRTTTVKPAFIDVEIFKGYKEGQTVRYTGQGNEAPGYENGINI